MLPLELAIAEPGSGKSFLYNLRRGVLTGRPSLDNIPVEIRDWYAQITGAAGIWVCDNVGDVRKDVRERMSDELARLITDPDPAVELRRLYTTADTGRFPVDCTFAVTAIQNPFHRPDLLQRSIILNFRAIPTGNRDGQWYTRQISGDGRARRVADHLKAIWRYLRLVQNGGWDAYYMSGHRLVHFEQALRTMGEALEFEDIREVVGALPAVVRETVASEDPIIDALREFAQMFPRQHPGKPYFMVKDILEYVQFHDEEGRWAGLQVLQSGHFLGKYLLSHAYDIEQAAGIVRTERVRHGSVLFRIKTDEEMAKKKK